jgi:hypothetical protein
MDLPGGASGLLVHDYKGKEANVPVVRIDPGVVSLVAELRGHERQAAGELEQMSQALNRPRGMVRPPKYFPANAAAPDGRPRMDGCNLLLCRLA